MKKIQMIIFGIFLIQMFSLFPKKVQMKQTFRKLIFLESFFLRVNFCLEKLRKDERHLRKEQKEEKREKHNKRKKNRGTIEK